MPSMFGDQVSSTRRSAPGYGFGSSTRAHAQKVFVSKEHSMLASKGISPGPQYTIRSTVGPQVDGAIRSEPQWGVSKAARFKAEKSTALGPGSYESHSSISSIGGASQLGGKSTRTSMAKVYISNAHSSLGFNGNSPGQIYDDVSSVGKQNASPKKNQPAWVWGSQRRFRNADVEYQAKMPGPGTFEQGAGAFGSQPSSMKRSSSMPGFGKSTRLDQTKVYSSPAQERTKNFGKASPGPATYLPPIMNHSSSGGTFGKCDRFYMRKTAMRMANNPPPGAYDV